MSGWTCVKCSRRYPNSCEHWQEVIGYARPRSQRGVNSGSSLIGRELTGNVVCAGCASRLQAGLAIQQQGLGI